MDITFSIPHAFSPSSPEDDNSDVLRVLLDCLVRLNLAYLRNHSAPALYQSGVVYGRTLLWEPIPAIIARGYGDCKSLAPWLIAEYVRQGIPCQPVFRFIQRPDGSGELDFHILVHRTDIVDGRDERMFQDPSRILGMGRNENEDIGRNIPMRMIAVDQLPRGNR